MSDLPALLVEFETYLRSRSDAGVLRFLEGFDWDMPDRALQPASLPVVSYLPAGDGDSPEGRLLAALRGAAPRLRWQQTYGAGDFGAAFMARYGWMELFGTRGHFDSEAMAGGILMLGPDIHYPDHHHVAEEIYVPLTPGSLWSMDSGTFVPRGAGEIIHHPSGIRHAMRTVETPLVALYLWRGGPLAQKPDISGRDR